MPHRQRYVIVYAYLSHIADLLVRRVRRIIERDRPV